MKDSTKLFLSMMPDLQQTLRKCFGPSKDVIHRATCPVCGRDLVNLYRYDKEYLCRTCKLAAEKIDKVMKHVHE